MKQNCKKCSNEFTLDADDLSFYEKIGVQIPLICPNCRFKIRASFRNERTLYNQNCKLCNRGVITMYNPKSPYVVYCHDCFYSDKWDARDYAVEYDFSKPFFDQFKDLSLKVPQFATYSSTSLGTNINSEYVNFGGGNKDCYLTFNSAGNDNCAYTRGLVDSKDSFDAYNSNEVENIYESININKSNGVSWSQNCNDCIDSSFLLNCNNCQNCFGCINLRNKSYCLFNEQLEREEWIKIVEEIQGSYKKIEEFKKKFYEFSLSFPRRSSNNFKNVDCSGDNIYSSKNCKECFEVSFGENMKYSFSAKKGKDSADMLGYSIASELLFNGVGVGGNSSRIICSWCSETSSELAYCFTTRSSTDCFGCAGLKNGKYCILNKQYSKEEYEKIKNHIVSELKEAGIYGEYFPLDFSPFGYNETIAEDNIPLTKEQALEQGFRWEDDIQKTEGRGTINMDDIPDNIKDTEENIIENVFTCEDCSRNYKIIQREFVFYKKRKIPIPRKCWNCRFTKRIELRGPYKFWDRSCAKCNKNIYTNYAPDRPEIVYCEKCYQQEVY